MGMDRLSLMVEIASLLVVARNRRQDAIDKQGSRLF
jgi:hypothetical protein